jgi:copper chaperone NosL
MKQIILALAGLLGLTLAACGGTADADAPPDIRYGRDICIQCGMIINEEKFAAAYTLDDGTERIFDDLGGLLLHQRATDDMVDPEHTWVHDFETAEWVEVADAFFVATLAVNTPMGHSVLAFNDEDAAVAFASDVDGEVIRWDVVFVMPERDGLVGDHHMDMDMDDESTDHDHEG